MNRKLAILSQALILGVIATFAITPAALAKPATPAKSAKLPSAATVSYEKLTPAISKPTKLANEPKLHPQAVKAYTQGKKLFKDQDYNGAVDKLGSALSYNPKSIKIRRDLAMAFNEMGNSGQAYEHLAKVLAIASDDIEGQVLLGTLALAQRRTDRAILAFRTALICTGASEENPLSAISLLHLTALLDQAGRLQASLDLCEKLSRWLADHSEKYGDIQQLKSLALKPQSLYSRRGSLLLRLNKPAKAVKLLNLAYQRDKTNKLTAKRLLDALAAAKQYKQAENLVAEMSAEPALNTIVAGLAQILCHAQAPSKTAPLRIWNLCVDKGINDPLMARSLARAALLLKSTEDAATILVSAFQASSLDANLGKMLAEVYIISGQFEEALECFSAVIDGNTSADDSIRSGVKVLLQSKPSSDLLENFVKRIAQKPPAKRYAMQYVAGIYAQMLGKSSRAAELFAMCVKSNPTFLPACQQFVEMSCKAKKIAQAEELLQTLPTEGDNAYFSFYLKGILKLAQKQSRQAAGLLEKSTKLNSKYAPALVQLARAYERSGKVEEAGKCFLAAAFLRQNSARYYGLFTSYLLRQGRKTEAIAVAKRSVERASGIESKIMLADAYLARGKPSEATAREASDLIDDLAKTNSDNSDVKILLLRKKMDASPKLPSKKSWSKDVESASAITFGDPDNIRSQTLLAEMLMTPRYYSLAIHAYKGLYELTQGRHDVADTYGRILMRVNKPATAQAIFENLIDNDPQNMRARKMLLESLSMQKKNDVVFALLQKWLATEKRELWMNSYRWDLLESLSVAGKYDQGQKVLDSWQTERAYDELSRRIEKVRFFVKAGQHDRAIKYASDLVGEIDKDIIEKSANTGGDPDEQAHQIALAKNRKSMVRLSLAVSLSESKQYKKLHELLDKWIEDKNSAENEITSYKEMKIVFYGEAGNFDHALSAAQEWIKLAPQNRQPRIVLVETLWKNDENIVAGALLENWITAFENEAKADTQKKAQLQETLAWAQAKLVATTMRTGNHAQALKQVESYLKIRPTDIELLLLKSSCLGELAQDKQQLAVLEQIMLLKPDDPEIKNNLGYVLANLGQELVRAERMIRQAYLSSEGSGSIAVTDSLGWVLYKQGKFEQAGFIFLNLIDAAEQVYASRLRWDSDAENPIHPIIYDHAGDALYRLGWQLKAKKMWTNALAVAKQHKPSAELEQVLKNTPKKLQALKDRTEPTLAPAATPQEKTRVR